MLLVASQEDFVSFLPFFYCFELTSPYCKEGGGGKCVLMNSKEMFDKREKKNGQLEANAPLSACEAYNTSGLVHLAITKYSHASH